MRFVLAVVRWIWVVCRGAILPCSLAALFSLGCEEFHESGAVISASVGPDNDGVRPSG